MAVQAELSRAGVASFREDRAILQPSAEQLAEPDRDLVDRMCRLYEGTGFHAPRPDELPGRLSSSREKSDRLLEYLCSDGRLVRLSRTVVLSYKSVKKAQDLVVAAVGKDGMLDSADFKHAIGSSRKYALAILDYLDTRGVTLRMGNIRKLAPGYEKHLV
jgi:selenocysteine-specific elongation factor